MIKKILFILGVSLLFPINVLGATVPWNRPSVGLETLLYPQDIISIASTTGTSTFAGNLDVTGNIKAGQIITPMIIPTSGTLTVSGLVLSGFSNGSVLYTDSTGKVSQDNSNFFWDATNHRLGIGTTTPSEILTVSGNEYLAGSLVFSSSTPVIDIGYKSVENIIINDHPTTHATPSPGVAIGSSNTLYDFLGDTYLSFAMGDSNISKGSFVFGFSNTATSTSDVGHTVVGNGNIITVSPSLNPKVFVAGNGNTLTKSSNIGAVGMYGMSMTAVKSNTVQVGYGTTYLLIDSTNHTGIGTTSPTTRFSVSSFNYTGANGRIPLFLVSSSSAAIATTTYIIVDAYGKTGIGTATPDSTLDVNGTVRFEGASSFVSPSISGALAGIGCDTGDTTGLTGLSSTTAFITTPQADPGAGVWFYTLALTSTSARTYVCSDVAVTPTASTYNVKIIR